MTALSFISRWTPAERAERTNAQRFLIELCTLLGVPPPAPASGTAGPYSFERSVTHHEADSRQTTRRIDLYKQGCFILEAKQGANIRPQQSLFPDQSESTRGQAEGYVHDLPTTEAAPPFLIVADTRHRRQLPPLIPSPEARTKRP